MHSVVGRSVRDDFSDDLRPKFRHSKHLLGSGLQLSATWNLSSVFNHFGSGVRGVALLLRSGGSYAGEDGAHSHCRDFKVVISPHLSPSAIKNPDRSLGENRHIEHDSCSSTRKLDHSI